MDPQRSRWWNGSEWTPTTRAVGAAAPPNVWAHHDDRSWWAQQGPWKWVVAAFLGLVIIGGISDLVAPADDKKPAAQQSDSAGPAASPASDTEDQAADPGIRARFQLTKNADGVYKTTKASATVVGTIDPAATLTQVHWELRRTTGTTSLESGAANVQEDGSFEIDLSGLHLGEYLIVLDHEEITSSTVPEESIGILRQRTPAQIAAIREAREAREAAARERRAEEQAAREAQLTQTFSGNGGKSLGTIDIEVDSKIVWTNDGGIMQIFIEDPFGVPVNSQGASGDSFIEAGTYHGFEVNAMGNWTITIQPA